LKLNATGKNENRQIFVGLGSNIAPEQNLPRAVARLNDLVEIQEGSSVWETPPVGGPGPNFLNAVIRIETDRAEDELRDKILRPIETGLGRYRTADPNAPRTIDLDILIFAGQVREPEIWKQAHWSVPLAELVPNLKEPGTGEMLASVAGRLAAATRIVLRSDVPLDIPERPALQMRDDLESRPAGAPNR
jgi:2-amino-4-hydroxy-6-hydroxymethyldihydropteridine diphosphokinase